MIKKHFGYYEITSFLLRCFFDLQFKTIVDVLRSLTNTKGNKSVFLDFGAGTSPYKKVLKSISLKYYTLDPSGTVDFKNLDQVPKELSPDVILLVEVLEHVKYPVDLVKTLQKKFHSASFWVSVPFSARVHNAPSDYHRWTPEGLKDLFFQSGMEIERIIPRGNDFTTIISKILYFNFRNLLNPYCFFFHIPFLLLIVPLLLICAHFTLRCSSFSQEDPLGYFMVIKPYREPKQ